VKYRPPSEEAIQRLAADLGEDADLLLALAGKVATESARLFMQRPIPFAEIIRGLSDVPEMNCRSWCIGCAMANGRNAAGEQFEVV